MNKSEKLALFLGMLSGDGCLSITYNKEGYRNYPICFCNTDKTKVVLFDDLFFNLFGIRGKISSRTRPNRKEIWEFKKYSVSSAKYIVSLGFPEGVKRDVLRVPKIIWDGSEKEKTLFIYGMTITDGYIDKYRKSLRFHLGSKLFLEDLSLLISQFIGVIKPVKEFTQREVYKSYQLSLNKKEFALLLSRHGTMVLRWS